MSAVVVGERYRLEERLGQGGTGEVYRAFDARLERQVAIKLLHPWVADDEEARQRFRREATVMARLRHVNIVAIHDFDDSAERPYLVQEFCPGGTLAALTDAAPLHWDRVQAIAQPILRALDHAHANGVIHRDLKPSNVLFAADGHLVVGDFGLARALATDHSITASGVRIGSPEFWSPEQAAGKPLSEKSDMYALGCILYQLGTGALPFPGDDRLAAGYRRVHEDPRPPEDCNPLLPRDAERLIRALMQRDPVLRPRAADVLEAFSSSGRAQAPDEQATAVFRDDATRLMPPPPVDPTDRVRVVDDTVVAPPPPPAPAPLVESDTPPPARRLAPQPSALAPAAASRPGVALGPAVVALLLGGAAAAIGLVARSRSDRVDLRRTGLTLRHPLSQSDSRAALVLIASAAVVTLSVVLVAIWSARGSGRARWVVVRVLLGALAVAFAAASAAALVWTAHAAATSGLSSLWRDAQ